MAKKVCATKKKNFGNVNCDLLPGMLKGMIETPLDFSFTADEAEDPDFWQEALLATVKNRPVVWPDFITNETISTEAVYEDLPLGFIPVRDGNYRWRFGIKKNLCLHKKMFSRRTSSARVLMLDINAQALATIRTKDGKYQGLRVDQINTEKLLISDGSVSSKSPLVVALKDNTEIDQRGIMFDASFFGDLNLLTDVTIEIISIDEDEIKVSVFADCDGTLIEGLLTADFLPKDVDGVAQAKTVVETSPGFYTITATSSFVDGTLSLRSPDLLTVKAYEAEPVDLVIPS